MLKVINNIIFKTYVLALVVTACNSGQPFKEELVYQLRSSCGLEAELLVKPAFSYEKPVESKLGVTILESGRFIYRCGKRNGWVAVMYPKMGEKVDCNYRDDKNQCPIGWVKDELITSNID